MHVGRGDADLAGQFAFGPVRGALGDLFQGADHYLLHLGVGDGARHPGAGLIAQPVQPAGQEAGPPPGHGAAADAQPRGDGDIGPAVRAGQDDPCPQRQPLSCFRRFAQFSSVRRSASDSTSGSSLLSPIPSADCTNRPAGTPATQPHLAEHGFRAFSGWLFRAR